MTSKYYTLVSLCYCSLSHFRSNEIFLKENLSNLACTLLSAFWIVCAGPHKLCTGP